MGLGTATGGVCYASQAEAASMWCASVNAGTSAGLLTCKSVNTALPDTSGGLATFNWTRQTVDGGGTRTTSTVSGQQLLGCETYDVAYFEPVITAFIGALVAILCARWLINFFRSDRETV